MSNVETITPWHSRFSVQAILCKIDKIDKSLILYISE